MRITSVYPTGSFKLIMEFDQIEYRIIDFKVFLSGDTGILSEIRDNVEVFMSAEIDPVAGTIRWANGVDFDPHVLYAGSMDLERAFR